MKHSLIVLCLMLGALVVQAQQGTIRGRVISATTHQPIEFATVQIKGTGVGKVTDASGAFTLTGVRPGFVRLMAEFVGYEPKLSPEIHVIGNQTSFVDIELTESVVTLGELVIRPRLQLRKIESPLSLLTLGVQEIEKGAGVNRDVSKAMQTLPGVGVTDPNRNDLIVRGGGPAENVFYLDGVEIPVINHFSTQGASGGVIGIINPDFVQEIDFYSGAFPAQRTGALSAVMEVKQRDGSPDRLHAKGAVGASDAALTLEGPLGKRTTFIVSVRKSYLQFLFKALGLPFLPTYDDMQFKVKHRINERNEISLIGLGAIDKMRLNLDLRDSGTESQRYLLGYLPEYDQWNYTIGAVYRRFGEHTQDTWVLSRNMLRNANYKHPDNDYAQPRSLDYRSDEAESKLRVERSYLQLPFKLLVGAGLEYAHYTNTTRMQIFRAGMPEMMSYSSDLDLFSYEAFAQASDQYLDRRLSLSIGLSAVGNTLTRSMRNPLPQLSPRLSASYALTDEWDLNASVGRYAMRPAYTSLGYRDGMGSYVNLRDEVTYIYSTQAVLGVEYRPTSDARFTVETFYKGYDHYPLSIKDGISLASRGAEYGQVGDEAIISTGTGRAYGVELYGKMRLGSRIGVTGTYTFFRSEFTDISGVYRPSAWDTRHQLSLLGSYRLPSGWNISARWRLVGGAPYSPIDMDLSTDRQAWAVRGRAYLDYKQYNTLRLPVAHQLDLRVDKEFYIGKWMLNIYADVQNAYGAQSSNPPIYTNLDASGNLMLDPVDPARRQTLRSVESLSGQILPTIGIIVRR